jgi:membrane-associated phospholipid phosphatase
MHEIEIIVNFWIQSMGTWLKIPMQVFSFLGTQNAYILVMSWLYWCVNSQLGIRIGIILLSSNGLNTAFKWIFHSPRPYWINPNIKALAIESSFGIPSGHAMVSTSVWGRIAMWVKKPWVILVIVIMLFFIGFSRLYLGVHFLSDVVAGWLLGISLLIFLSFAEKPLAKWLNKQKMSIIILFAFLTSISIIIFFMLLKVPFNQWQIPESWINNSQIAAPGSVIDPFKIKDIVLLSGTWFGLIAGYFWIKKMGNFNQKGNLFQLVIRFLIGFVGIVILVFGLNSILPEMETWFSFTLIYLQYFLVSLWIVALAPMLFIKFGLANKKS